MEKPKDDSICEYTVSTCYIRGFPMGEEREEKKEK